MADTFHLSVITPERAVLETDATFAALPAHDGELGILKNRAPMLYRLGAGLLRADTVDGKCAMFVAGGFAQKGGNPLSGRPPSARGLHPLRRAGARKGPAEGRLVEGGNGGGCKGEQSAVG